MKILFFVLPVLVAAGNCLKAQSVDHEGMIGYDTIKTASHIKGLNLAILHLPPAELAGKTPVLFIHGSSVPSSLSFGFRMGGYSWMDQLAENGIESFALDFLGYGNSDRYPEMAKGSPAGTPVGRATEAYKDIDSAVNLVIKRTGVKKIDLVAHSWGASVALLYASKFPDMIHKLVLFAPLTLRNGSEDTGQTGSSYEEMTPETRVEQMDELAPKEFRPALEKKLDSVWKKTWLQSDVLARDNKSKMVRFPAGPGQDIEDLKHNRPYYDPAEIKVPVLIIRGEWDSYPSNEDAGNLFSWLAHAPSKKYVVIAHGSHVMHLERSRTELYREALNFLSSDVTLNQSSQIAVIFEVVPQPGEKQEYLDIAAKLRPLLTQIDGFISIERFQSLANPDKLLSLSFWRDEKAIREWRNVEMHRDAQDKGRSYILKDYHLRIADVVRNYGMFDRIEAPADSKARHDKRPD
jgi:pimeloyl-ACP methyl ester carboxylesterase/heme-degrading monooxygenase HmoA